MKLTNLFWRRAQNIIKKYFPIFQYVWQINYFTVSLMIEYSLVFIFVIKKTNSENFSDTNQSIKFIFTIKEIYREFL